MFVETKNVSGIKKRSYKSKLSSQSPNCNGSKMLSSVAHYDNELLCLHCMALCSLVWTYVAWPRMVLSGLVWPYVASYGLVVAFYCHGLVCPHPT